MALEARQDVNKSRVGQGQSARSSPAHSKHEKQIYLIA